MRTLLLVWLVLFVGVGCAQAQTQAQWDLKWAAEEALTATDTIFTESSQKGFDATDQRTLALQERQNAMNAGITVQSLFDTGEERREEGNTKMSAAQPDHLSGQTIYFICVEDFNVGYWRWLNGDYAGAAQIWQHIPSDCGTAQQQLTNAKELYEEAYWDFADAEDDYYGSYQ